LEYCTWHSFSHRVLDPTAILPDQSLQTFRNKKRYGEIGSP
jgi:hypothetical protein